jgi:hypothetical protein
MAQPQNLPRGLDSGRVMLRFCLRILILASFAAFSSIGFGKSLVTLLWMAMVFSTVVAIVRSERPLAAALNHWDETAGYAALLALAGIFGEPLPA